MDACLLLLCLFSFFGTKPRDWLRGPSPKQPILCRVGRKIVTPSQFVLIKLRRCGEPSTCILARFCWFIVFSCVSIVLHGNLFVINSVIVVYDSNNHY